MSKELVTGKQCEWDDIEIGEVFVEDCNETTIFYKEDKHTCILLDSVWEDLRDEVGTRYWADKNKIPLEAQIYCYIIDDKLYKLPKSVQALWKEE